VVAFFFYEDPGLVLGKFIADLPVEVQNRVWFSHGLASIILFTTKNEEIESIRKIESHRFRGVEIWKIEDGKIKSQTHELVSTNSKSDKRFEIADTISFPAETHTIVTELRHCLNTAVARAEQFLPSSLKSFERLYPAVNEIIHELEKAEKTNPQSNNFVAASPSGVYTEPSLARVKRRQQLLDQLIQINAALSYVISQAYAGIAPILQHECQIRKHSLLGVGAAHNGMAAFSEFCELTFQSFPVDSVIKREFKKQVGEPYAITNKGETPSEWNKPRFNVDAYIEDFPAQTSKLNLAYFSGRLGFRETQFTVTAPVQALMHCAMARWSLMTLTHELMHAHVRAILGAVFASLTEGQPGKNFERAYQTFQKQPRGGVPETLLETVQFVIFDYCEKKPSVDTAAERLNAATGADKITEVVRVVDAHQFTTRLQSYYREINEVFVHVLDFNYFYDCREEPYLTLLWTSWAPVASVIDNVEEYLLRSVLAISSKSSGNNATRFEQARSKVADVLEQLQNHGIDEPLFSYALTRINDSVTRKKLLARFCLGIYLVDLAQKSFVSKHLHSRLYDDENRVKNDLEYEYVLETGQFTSLPIRSPVALVSDLLRREAKGEKVNLPIDYVSAWMFLICGSAPIERERTPNVSR
jgi:hypothetical protein